LDLTAFFWSLCVWIFSLSLCLDASDGVYAAAEKENN
jgi:hypothetical protein